MSVRCATGVLATALLIPVHTGRAHPAVGDRIEALDHRIEHRPRDPALYLRRGELHTEDGRFDAARRDFDRAERLAPTRIDIHFYRGAMLVEADDPAAAVAELSTFLAEEPGHAKARLLRARARTELGDHRGAADDLSAALDALSNPPVSVYFDRARALMALGEDHYDEALQGLDEGCARLQFPVVLVELAVEIETGRRRWEAALARLDALDPATRRTPHALARRADLLRHAGRTGEALLHELVALHRVVHLPSARASTPAMTQLAGRLRASIAGTLRGSVLPR